MTIDAIRRKHEAQITYTKERQGDFPYLFQSIHSNLSISDVDTLFAALDAERGKVERIKEMYVWCIEAKPYQYKEFAEEVWKILKGGGDE